MNSLIHFALFVLVKLQEYLHTDQYISFFQIMIGRAKISLRDSKYEEINTNKSKGVLVYNFLLKGIQTNPLILPGSTLLSRLSKSNLFLQNANILEEFHSKNQKAFFCRASWKKLEDCLIQDMFVYLYLLLLVWLLRVVELL